MEKINTKRVFDVFFTAAGLILLAPLFIAVTLLVKLGSPGPVFFVQRRMGRNFRPFNLYKFRSMVDDAPRSGISITVAEDPRITGIGRLLRKTKIDELPQLWNVLKGDMSLVGPRPEVEKYVEIYRSDYEEILRVSPGITDLASLTFKDEEKVLKEKTDPEEFYIHVLLPEKIKMAKEYVRKASVLHDLKLILLTILKLVYPHDAVTTLIEAFTPYRRPIVIGTQILIFVLSSYLAFLIRFDADIPASELRVFLKYLPVLIIIRVLMLLAFSLGKGLWRYVSTKDLANIILATSLGSLMFVFIIKVFFDNASYPRSVYVVDWFLNVFLLSSIRLFRRLHDKRNGRKVFKKRVIIIGAGDGAEMLLRDVDFSPYYPYEVIGLIDESPSMKGLRIRNFPILGSRGELPDIVEKERPDEFIIAIPSASRPEFTNLLEELRQYGLPIKTMPSLWSILSGRGSLNSLRAIEPEDILFRAPALNGSIDLRDLIEGKRVLVTGAGGSIGSELSRQIAGFNPERLILYERHEENLYNIGKSLRSPSHSSRITPVIGDILDEKRMNDVMGKYRPQVIFHAAAYKHVPMMENNPYEAVRTNVYGTKIVAEKAIEFGAERFVLISTDKAVNPVNVMGMTKKIAEEVVIYLASGPASNGTQFMTVRFGNVLESSGSVVPLFKDQISRGGPVTVTHPEMTRFFMTISEAVRLVLQAAAIGKGGEVFVLEMGKAVKILDLAKRMISLYGYKPGVDIEIVFSGLRPGEKLNEELFNSYETVKETSHDKINMADLNGRARRNVLKLINSMEKSGFWENMADTKGALKILLQVFSEEQPPSQVQILRVQFQDSSPGMK
jgi:FlaA1/EpsC-like NDP-sugar epimerase/lipopolysaccharide/colanic/teichoic acid biosynthesis glycosyltransferase